MISKKKEKKYSLSNLLDHTGFCTVFDDDFNQTFKFEIKTINHYENGTYFEILCTDNGQPPLSVHYYFLVLTDILVLFFAYSKVSTWIKVLPDNMTLMFVPVLSLIIPVNDNNNTIDKQTRDNIVISYSNDGDKTERQRRQANSPPQNIYFNILHLTIPENARDYEIANVYVTDEDNDNYVCTVHTYDAPEDSQPFDIVNGILRTSLIVQDGLYNINYEKIPVYNITVTCTDPIHQYTIRKHFTIDVIDINEPPIQLILVPDTLPENSPMDYVIGCFYASDPDLPLDNQTFEYSIAMNPNGMFRMDNDQLILQRTNDVEMCISQPDLCPHDYEQITSLLIRINIKDNGQPSVSQKFWIQIRITDENDPPVNLQLNQNFIRENSPIGALIGSFSVEDQDLYQTHTYTLVNQSPLLNNGYLFVIEDNNLRLLQSPDYELDSFYIITVQCTDNGTPPASITSDFLIEIIDVDELPDTYIFIPNPDGIISDDIINDLMNGRQTPRTIFLPQSTYSLPSLGQIVFLMEDRDRDIDLTALNDDDNPNELGFSKPTCELSIHNPDRLLCTSIVTVINPRLFDDDNNTPVEHLIINTLILTSNDKTMTFPKPLRIKIENITLTINDTLTLSIDVEKSNISGIEIGKLQAIDLAAGGELLQNIALNSNSYPLFPFELVNLTTFKVRDDMDLSLSSLPSIFNISVLVTTVGEDSRIVEKYFIINIKDKKNVSLILSNNKIQENSPENTSVGYFILQDGIGNYTINLIDDANGYFKLNNMNLLTAQKIVENCRLNHTCQLNHEIESTINITVAILDPITNETYRHIRFLIQIEDENEPPYNITLSLTSVSKDAEIGNIVGIINAMDDDINQTLTYTTTNPLFNIIDNQLILSSKLDHESRNSIPVYIRATDDGQPSRFTEQLFFINVTSVNQEPLQVTSTPMIYYIPKDSNSIPTIIGQLTVIDPDENENFNITFNNSNYQASIPQTNTVPVLLNNVSAIYAQIYNINIMDLNPPTEQNDTDYYVNVTAYITDSGNHTLTHEFSIHYLSEPITNSTIPLTMTSSIPTTIIIASLSQALHVRIYETTPSGTPITRGLLSSLISNNLFSNSSTCITTDEQGNQFPMNVTNIIQSTFIIFLPNNYTLNSTIHPTIILTVQCIIDNDMDVNQAIVIDVLPAPPTIQIEFNQTQPFYATNNINNDTILGSFYLTESTIDSINRTYNLSLRNNQDIFQLLPDNSLIQIGPYSSDLLEIDNPYVNLTIQAIETTFDQPICIIQTTFNISIIVNLTIPFISCNQTSIPNDTNPDTIIGNFTVHNITIPYRLQLLDTYDDGLELDPNTNILKLKRTLNTFPLLNNNTQLLIKVALVKTTNETIVLADFPLTITYSTSLDSCLNQDCGNGTCINVNETISYCLCTSGYTGLNCHLIDSCAFNPCTNNGICHQLSTRGDFSCQCLPNYSGSRCEILIDVCQLNTSLCSSTDICIPINNNLTNFFTCISRDELQYLVFDYLNDYKKIDIINDKDLPKKLEDFIKNNLFDIENIIVPERKILGPYAYNRAELISIGVQSTNDNSTTLNESLNLFCTNQSSTIDLFATVICAGYRQASYLDEYFKSTPTFSPNCTFTDAADKYYWFDKTIPFLPLWITLIVGSLLMAAIPLIPMASNVPKKVALPLMKAKKYPDQEEEEYPLFVNSILSATKNSRKSYRERNDSGYESNEDSKNYLEQIITNYQQQQESFHVYPILHGPRSPTIDRQITTIDDLVLSNSTHRSRSPISSIDSRRDIQRSSSMSSQRTPRQSNQTLKPIIQRPSMLFESSIGTLIGSMGLPKLNHDDDTYVSTKFRNENTSKFLMGTLWNTFALVNNLFLQRPRKRRNALSGDTNIRVDQLARLQELYSLAEREQANELPINNLQSIINEILTKQKNLPINNLRAIIFDILSSSKKPNQCNCYGNRHIPSCIYYDQSLPYLRPFNGNTSNIEHIFDNMLKSNQPRHRNILTQPYVRKPARTFTHSKPTNNIATQSSPPPLTLTQLHYNASTQYSPKEVKHMDDISTQTILNKFHDVSTQFSSIEIINNSDNFNIVNQLKPKKNQYNDHVYVNISPQLSPQENKSKHTNISTQVIEDQRNTLMNELKEVFTIPKEELDRKSPPNHTVRSLVSMFETTTPVNKLHINIPNNKASIKSNTNDSKVSNSSNKENEKIPSSINDDVIEQYVNEVVSNIVDNAILTAAIETTNYSNEQQQQQQLQRRFSFYSNGGGHGKSLLFQSNTFVPTIDIIKHDTDENFRGISSEFFSSEIIPSSFSNYPLVESQASNVLINDTVIPNESQHTLIVGRYINGDESNRSKTKKQRSFIYDTNNNNDSSSLSSFDDEQPDHQQFLSNSQLFSAHELYIRPWLVRRATAPDIHCLDNDINDTYIEIIPIDSIDTYFNIFPSNPILDLATRYTCLITILLYLHDVHDEYSNEILYDELDQIHKQIIDSLLPSPIAPTSNVFQTTNQDGSKRYRTGFVLDINSPNTLIRPKLYAKQIEWKHVKIIIRRFRKKYQHYKQLIKNDKKTKSNQFNIENYLKYFDSTSKRRMIKYAKHYAEKL
ncbi:unnamed protein product [Adineta steineri]|uniref:Uncharacterized protein n=3 Tax=Adineta steineri TaxID=433720 RepID=A0A813MXN6_9BILA|nr:unnamed protein product [Adineta steineri]